MTIGEALKKERIRMGLTQDEMADGIIKKSHYSKVERNIEGISADSLFKILFLHNIDLDVFLNEIKDEYSSNDKVKARELEAKVMEAFNNSDNDKIESYLSDVLKLPGNMIFKYRTIIAIAYFRNQLDELSPEFKEKIITEFIKYDSWIENIDSLRLLANCMQIFPIKQLDECIKQILRNYSKTDVIYPEIMIERVAIICNNYLHHCYYSNIKGAYTQECLDFLESLDNRTHFLFYKVTEKFYQYLYEGQLEKAREVKNQLITWGYGSRVSSWKI